MIDWDNKLPRFLFRGFHAASGARTNGSSERHELCDVGSLNTKKYIIPYAFRPKGIKIMERLTAGPVDKLPSTKTLVQDHVFNCSGPDEDCSIWGPTPFSSWTPDLHNALYFARLIGKLMKVENSQSSFEKVSAYCGVGSPYALRTR